MDGGCLHLASTATKLPGRAGQIRNNEVSMKNMRVLLLLLSCVSCSYISGQYFSKLYYDNRPSMLFGSIKAINDHYYVTGVTDIRVNPYTEKALFGKINSDGSVDSIYGLIDSDQNFYEIFYNSLKKLSDGNLVTVGSMGDSIPRVFMAVFDTGGLIHLWKEYNDTDATALNYLGMDVTGTTDGGYMIAVAKQSANYNSNVVVIKTDRAGNIINK